MRGFCCRYWLGLAVAVCAASNAPGQDRAEPGLTISWADNYLTIRGAFPGGEIPIHYLEAYCRPGSTDRDWGETVIGHRTELVAASDDQRIVRLRDRLTDGVIVEHTITAGRDEIDFQLTAHNSTDEPSLAHWAQPCIRVDRFTGDTGKDARVLVPDYARKCFVFVDEQLTRLPTKPWADRARYVPGQVYCPAHVSRSDVNPRPLSTVVPSNGLVGCFSSDERAIMAVAWEPYQELFQGVAQCIHSDFRLGGLQAGETKQVQGKLYIVSNDVPALLQRYARDFAEQQRTAEATDQGLTSLANPTVRYVVTGRPYAVLRRDGLEAIIVDNRAVDDSVLPGHQAGYHGIASLKHERQARNLFVPKYAGLNFEHIHDGTAKPRDILFEPRHAPMELRVVDEHTAELYQSPTPHWRLESCLRYELLPNSVVELTFECIPRRNDYQNGYIGLFWASYIDRPEALDVHFRGVSEDSPQDVTWQRGVTPTHGSLATHRPLGDWREFTRDASFPLELPFSNSQQRYAEPWYFGVCRGMAFAQSFRSRDRVWLTQSPSGGGAGCPAWDFQWHIVQPRVGGRYQLKMRATYVPLENPDDAEVVRSEVERRVSKPM